MAIKLRLRDKTPLFVLLGLLLTCFAYWPGLSGGFVFDDLGSLAALGAKGPIHDGPAFWRYITSGTADPTGRPLTLATFLLDARNWPASPYPFKRTNLILHLLNGALLFALLYRLGLLAGGDARRARLSAAFASTVWLLHPLLVSTTLYIVQREAMLPATLVMAGLLCWLKGRARLAEGVHSISGSLWILAGLGLGTCLATLAKANGALLPVYAVLIEYVVLAHRHPFKSEHDRNTYRRLMRVLGVVPCVAIAGYLGWHAIEGVISGATAPARPWTLSQRLLTEPRILLDYLRLLWVPTPNSSGLFHDHYRFSSSWLQPMSTLPSIMAVFCLIAGAWGLRKRHPVLALSVLFFFAGHLAESTSIPLELYFEHRNYVPSLLMFWPLGWWLADTRSLPAPKYLALFAFPIALACMTFASARVWGDTRTQALVWAGISPDSPRAQAFAAQAEMQEGRADLAVRRLQSSLAREPKQLQLALPLISARCMAGGAQAEQLAQAKNAMQQTLNPTSFFTSWFDGVLPLALSGRCPGLNPDALLSLIDAGLTNPRWTAPGQRQDLIYSRGRLALALHQPNIALDDFTRALDLEVRPDMAMEAAARLGAAHYPEQGLALLDRYDRVQGQAKRPGLGMPMLHAWILARQHYWPREEDHLKAQLALDAHARTPNNRTSTSKPGSVH